ncbi:MAG: YIP1 family protein, partial [Acidobacteriota bacterium]
IIALVLKLLADTILGAEIGFKRTLAAVTYGSLPNLLVAGLATIVMYSKPTDEFDLQNPLMFNAGAFLAQSTPLWIKTLAGAFDMFSFWVMLLIAMGLHAASPKKMSTGKAFGMILFPWALILILRTGAAAVSR